MTLNDRAGDGDTNRLEMLLYKQLGGRVPDLHVDVRGQGLILRGHTTTYYAKQLAQHAAARLTGLLVIANEIEVR